MVDLWGEVVGRLRGELSGAVFELFLGDSYCVGFEGGVLRVGVRNTFVREWIERRLFSRLERVLGEVASFHGLGKIKLVLEFPSSEDEYTFSQFIVGVGNRLAYQAAREVAEHPGKLNPLLLYSSSGLGKTHLLRAIAHAVGENHLHPIYISAHRFVEEFVFSVRNGLRCFQEKFRSSDILLLDDLHLLCGKTKVMDSFLCIFKEMIEEKKQVVVSSLLPPHELHIPEGLSCRLLSGFILPIHSPDRELRLNFLKAKASQLQLPLSEEFLNQLADKGAKDFPTLIGYLNHIRFGSLLEQEPHSKERNMVRAVAKYFMLPEEDLFSKTRKPQVSLARSILVYLLRQELRWTFPQIAKRLNISKSSAIYCWQKIYEELESPSSHQMQKALSKIKELA